MIGRPLPRGKRRCLIFYAHLGRPQHVQWTADTRRSTSASSVDIFFLFVVVVMIDAASHVGDCTNRCDHSIKKRNLFHFSRGGEIAMAP